MLTQTTSPDLEPDPSLSYEDQLKWFERLTEQRMSRSVPDILAKQSAMNLSNISLSTPLRLTQVRFASATKTRDSFLQSIVQRQTCTPTLIGITNCASAIAADLHKHNLFTHVRPRIVRDESALALENDVHIIIHVQDQPRISAKTETEVGGGEGTFGASVDLKNVFGGAEDFQASLKYGTQTKSAYTVNMSAPWQARTDTVLRGSIIRSDRHMMNAHATVAADRVEVNLARQWRSQIHTFFANLEGRTLSPLAYASGVLQRQAGISQRQGWGWRMAWDDREDRVMNYAGTRGQIELERLETVGMKDQGVSGWKTSLQASISRPWGFLHWVVSGTVSALILDQKSASPSVLDTLYVGGPTSVRLINTSAMGPVARCRDQDSIAYDYLGGLFTYSFGAALQGHLPSRAQTWPLKWQTWINAGLVASQIPSVTHVDLLRPTITAGLGLFYRFDPMRVELNVGIPIAARATDSVRKIQIGIGMDFM